ncbi:MAG: orotate phosphoribosyltransferase [Gemmatimonadota bacterium]
MNRTELAATIKQIALIHGDFLLRSGARSSHYFDKYRFESAPNVLRAIAEHMAPLVPPNTEVLAGLELGGIPLVTALSLQTGIPAAFVRKKAKEYGTAQLAEGATIAGRRTLVIEDVVTSGGQVVESCGAMRELGARIDTALCVIDRESGGAAALGAIGIELRPLFTRSEVS